jgi:tetratricopeptide (TPR) repeat protein
MSFKMNQATDFAIELAGIDKEIASLRDTAFAAPIDSEKATRFIYRLYQRASLTGNLKGFAEVETAIKRILHYIRRPADLYFLQANIAFKLHRLEDVKEILEMSRELRDSLPGRVLQADLDFQEGRYEDASKGYESIIQDDQTWDGLARLAHLKSKMGDAAVAEQLYIEAEDELTAKQMRHYAWVELQRGLIDLSHGRYEAAHAHYQQADRAYSGYWLVAEHLAELLGAQGRFDEAAALYQQVIGRLPRPEFQQALGELFTFMGKPEQAQPWLEAARAAYLESAQLGEVHYYHHLADFYADVREEGAEAVKWARQDIELRKNSWTMAALAWALYRNGQLAEALDTMERALAAGAGDAQMFFKAAEIYRANGKTNQDKLYLQKAAEFNPHYQNFHVHR